MKDNFNGRVDLRFSAAETEILARHFAHRPMANKTEFFKNHFWRSFLLTEETTLEENVSAIKAIERENLELAKHTQLLLAAFVEDMLDVLPEEKQARIEEIIASLPIFKE